MKNCVFAVLSILSFAAAPAFATVTVSKPSNNTVVGASAQYSATATTSCKQGVAAMGVYVDNQLVYTVNGPVLNHSLPLTTGNHSTYVQEWDQCGGSTGTPVQVKATNQSGIYIALPAANTSVSENVSFVASATTTCQGGIAAVGVYVNDQLTAVSPGSTLNQQVVLTPGSKKVVVQSWDYCGGTAAQPTTIQVADSSNRSIANTIYNIQAAPNWNQWGEMAPVYDICDTCAGIDWNMTQHTGSVSLSGNATRFEIGGYAPYGDVLWSNKLVGQATTQNLPDTDRQILPNVRHLQYDADFFVTDASVTQDLEFDVNIFMDGVGMEWGTECNNLAGKDWDIWDNVNIRWVSTGAPCHLVDKGWNHVSFEVERLQDNSLLYKTITLNGTTAILNRIYPAFEVPKSWYGMTVNYQMDGDYKLSHNVTYLDNLTVKYW